MRLVAFLACLAIVSVASARASAQDGGGIRAVVVDDSGAVISGATVTAGGPAVASTATQKDGTFVLSLPPGTYTVTVAKEDETPATVRHVVVNDMPVNLGRVFLHRALAALKVIGSTVARERSPFNASSASLKVFPREAYRDQGQPGLTAVLDQTPGALVARTPQGNAAQRGAAIAPLVRGGLPFETALSIDGDPIALPSSGTFDLSFLPSFVLQDVEVVKGPGSAGTTLPHAINGALNLRTAEPALARRALLELETDSRGGQFSDLAYGGTLPGGRLSFATMFAVDGSPGPLGGLRFPINVYDGDTVDGRTVAGTTTVKPNPATRSGIDDARSSQLEACCISVPSDFLQRAELVKLRYAASNDVTVTTTYLGSQGHTSIGSLQGFADPSGFFGSFAETPQTTQNHVFGLFSAEVHAALRRDAIVGRFYALDLHRTTNDGSNGPLELVLTGTAGFAGGTQQQYTGQLASVGFPAYPSSDAIDARDAIRGISAEYTHQVADNLYALAIDRRSATAGAALPSAVLIASGSREDDTLVRASALLHPNPRTEVQLGDGLEWFDDRFSANGGRTFTSGTLRYNSVRAGASYQLEPTLALRASLGSSVAPPSLAMLGTNAATVVTRAGFGLPAYAQIQSHSPLGLESSFAYDLGTEYRLRGGTTTLSADVYRVITHGAFVDADSLAGSFGPLPLRVNRWFNLGPATNEGVELALQQFKRAGLGYIVQGAFVRTFSNDYAPSFNGANLGILPGQNVAGGGVFDAGTNDIARERLPYAQGYGEISYKWPRGSRLSLGIAYYGANNPFFRPAFATLNSNLELSLGNKSKLQLSVENLTGAYDGALPTGFAGMAVPLADGHIAQTNANVLGPATIRMMFRQSIGGGGLTER
ncbi:MAG: TonB-dependent receptor domain-containing protein [Vulcanimicrobiaceae bacterium]